MKKILLLSAISAISINCLADSTAIGANWGSLNYSADESITTQLTDIRTEVNSLGGNLSAQIVAAKKEAVTESNIYADSEADNAYALAVAYAEAEAASSSNSAQAAAIAAAKIDATIKANSALAAAKTDSSSKADSALAAAKIDATSKADAAIIAAAQDAADKANAALAAAKTDAKTKTDAVQIAAAQDAADKANAAQAEAQRLAQIDATDYTNSSTEYIENKFATKDELTAAEIRASEASSAGGTAIIANGSTSAGANFAGHFTHAGCSPSTQSTFYLPPGKTWAGVSKIEVETSLDKYWYVTAWTMQKDLTSWEYRWTDSSSYDFTLQAVNSRAVKIKGNIGCVIGMKTIVAYFK